MLFFINYLFIFNYYTLGLSNIICNLFLLSCAASSLLIFFIISLYNELSWWLFLKFRWLLFLYWWIKWKWLDRIQLVFHLESSSCSWWEFLAFYQFRHIWGVIVILDVIFTLLEIMEFIGILVRSFRLLFSKTIDRFFIELTFAGIVQFLASFF